jgi:hypothetical protein
MTVEPEIQAPKMGRPSEFSQEIMAEICERMAEGKSLRQICEDAEMPNRRTIMRWVKNDDAAKKLYDAAQVDRMHWYADEIVNIAYDTSKDTITGNAGQPLCNHEWIARSRLKVDSLKFLMAKLAPRTYGDKLPENVAEKTGDLAELMKEIDGRSRSITVGWQKVERVIVKPPLMDGAGNTLTTEEQLRRRIVELEERLGLREAPQGPPKLITYDPGPLPARIDPEILARFLRMIKDTVPQADQRAPETVLDEVLSECERALQEKYASDAAE